MPNGLRMRSLLGVEKGGLLVLTPWENYLPMGARAE